MTGWPPVAVASRPEVRAVRKRPQVGAGARLEDDVGRRKRQHDCRGGGRRVDEDVANVVPWMRMCLRCTVDEDVAKNVVRISYLRVCLL